MSLISVSDIVYQHTLSWHAITYSSHLTLNMTTDIWDVIILGAGLSGLSASYLLRKRDDKLRILVLEGKGL